MNKFNFGPTRCGEILAEMIGVDKDSARKLGNFYHESCKLINEIKTIKNLCSRRSVLLSYIFYRSKQAEDLKIHHANSEELIKRIKFIIKNKALNE